MSEQIQTVENFNRSLVIKRNQAALFLEPVLEKELGGKYTDNPYGRQRSLEDYVDSSGRIWGIYDIEFEKPFKNQKHDTHLEIIWIKEGLATIKLGGKVVKEEEKLKLQFFEKQIAVKAGNLIIIPPGTPHGIRIEETLKTRVIMFPPYDRSDSLAIEVNSF